MNIDEALTRYVAERSRFKSAANAVKEKLEDLAKDSGTSVVVLAREKDPASYRAKVVEKGYRNAWTEVTDKAAARVIVSTASEVDRFIEAMHGIPDFVLSPVEDKRDVVHPETLSYSGVHVQVAAPAEAGDTERIECEVQVRTAAQDAWSVVSHKLLYKPVLELPRADQHAVYRLVALMELFDQEVERVSARLPMLPGYEFRDVLQTAESEFISLAHAQSYTPLSVRILTALGDAIPRDPEYPGRLHQWVADNAEIVRDAIRTYGPGSGLDTSYKYSLFSQAELLIVLERLAAEPFAFESAWRAAGLPIEWLSAAATYSEADVAL